MDYLYFLGNATLTLRIINHLNCLQYSSYCIVTVIHQINGWLLRIRFKNPLNSVELGNFNAYLRELGVPYQPDVRLQMMFWSLEAGQAPSEVMRRYQVALVSHGSPEMTEIEAFRRQLTEELGYCPEALA